MLTYILEVTLCWSILYVIFYACMRRETFFNVNRWYLMMSLILGLVIPLLRFIPTAEPINLYNRQLAEVAPLFYVMKDAPSQIAISVVENTRDWNSIIQYALMAIYTIGFIFFLFRFIKGLAAIRRLNKNGISSQKGNYTLIQTDEAHLPFSFLNTVYVSKTLPIDEDYNRILHHELEHLKARHSIDVLIVEVINIICWFHPMIYLYKSALRQTHEYLADAAVCGTSSRKLYGQLLLKQSLSGLEIALAHQFFHSHIKKRIKMIYQEKSGKKAWLKYALAVPTLLLLFLVFSGYQEVPEDQGGALTEIITSDESQNIDGKIPEKKLKREIDKLVKNYEKKSKMKLQIGLNVLYQKWVHNYPNDAMKIKKLFQRNWVEGNILAISPKGRILLLDSYHRLPNQESLTDGSFNRTIPSMKELSHIIKSTIGNEKAAILYNYLEFMVLYKDNENQRKVLYDLFNQYLRFNKIDLGLDLDDINIQFNITTPKVLMEHMIEEDVSKLPEFWSQGWNYGLPLKNSIDPTQNIGMFTYLPPSQATKIIGVDGENGLMAASAYSLPDSHPTVQAKKLERDIDNFFSTMNQLPPHSWFRKLKSVQQSLKAKYPNVYDPVTPFTNAAHKYNMNLVFNKEMELIKVYRKNEDEYTRLDEDDRKVIPAVDLKNEKEGSSKGNNSSDIISPALNISEQNPYIETGITQMPHGSIIVKAKDRILKEDFDYEIDYNRGLIKILNENCLSKGIPIRVSFVDSKLRESKQNTYPNAYDPVTPFTKAAHTQNINPVFNKEKELIKVYRKNGDEYTRLDRDDRTVVAPVQYQETITQLPSKNSQYHEILYNKRLSIEDPITNLRFTSIQSGLIKISVNDQILKEGTDYDINLEKGIVKVLNKKLLIEGTPIKMLIDREKASKIERKIDTLNSYSYLSGIPDIEKKQSKSEINANLEQRPSRTQKWDTVITYDPETYTEEVKIIKRSDTKQKTNWDEMATYHPDTNMDEVKIVAYKPPTKASTWDTIVTYDPTTYTEEVEYTKSDTLRRMHFDPKNEMITCETIIGKDTTYSTKNLQEYIAELSDFEKVENAMTSEILAYRSKKKNKSPFLKKDKRIKLNVKQKNDQINIEYESLYREDITFYLFDIKRHLIDSKTVSHSYPESNFSFSAQGLTDKVYFVGTIQGGRVAAKKISIPKNKK